MHKTSSHRPPPKKLWLGCSNAFLNMIQMVQKKEFDEPKERKAYNTMESGRDWSMLGERFTIRWDYLQITFNFAANLEHTGGHRCVSFIPPTKSRAYQWISKGEGIMPHTDGPAYDSCTATISLGGSDVIFKLWPRQRHDTELPTSSTNAQPSLEVILHGNGSLVLFTNDAYLYHLHEISEVLEERTSSSGICGNDVKGGTLVKRGYRISLTFRCKK